MTTVARRTAPRDVEEITGDSAMVIRRINELGDSGRLDSYELAKLADGQTYAVIRLLEPAPLPVQRVSLRPAVVAVAAGAGAVAVGGVVWGAVLLAEAIAANLAEVGAIVLVGLVVLAVAGKTCTTVVTITHRH